MVAKGYVELLRRLRARFASSVEKLPGVEWSSVEAALRDDLEKLMALQEMERTGGEPALVTYDEASDQYVFMDCSPESPAGRRGLVYDRDALRLRLRSGVRPKGSVLEMAAAMGVEVMSEEQYRWLQQRGRFDTRTSSWLLTPESVRRLGGAIFGMRRYETVFVCANSAHSFYSSRGFRAVLRV